MKLPGLDQAEVKKDKIAGYLLSPSHRTGRGKAEFFSGFGFSSERWDRLARALVTHAAVNEVATVEENQFGTRYTIEGELETPDGRRPLVSCQL
ncbi:MAG TPA: hypothetical protein VM658_16840 [bacterium]|nr:hypothetical protein [bacterium]